MGQGHKTSCVMTIRTQRTGIEPTSVVPPVTAEEAREDLLPTIDSDHRRTVNKRRLEIEHIEQVICDRDHRLLHRAAHLVQWDLDNDWTYQRLMDRYLHYARHDIVAMTEALRAAEFERLARKAWDAAARHRTAQGVIVEWAQDHGLYQAIVDEENRIVEATGDGSEDAPFCID